MTIPYMSAIPIFISWKLVGAVRPNQEDVDRRITFSIGSLSSRPSTCIELIFNVLNKMSLLLAPIRDYLNQLILNQLLLLNLPSLKQS